MALVLTALLFFSCNKNRFDFSEMDTIEGSGQWKLPVGHANVSLNDLMSQFGDNDMVSYDDDGNLQITYQLPPFNVFKGSDFLNLGTLNFSTEQHFPNPFPGISIHPIDTVFRFKQEIQLSADSAGIESAIIKSGELMLTFGNTNLGHISQIDFSSSGIIEPNGDTLVRHFNGVNGNTVDLAGASFYLHNPVTGLADSTLVLNYAIHYQMTGIDEPEYTFEAIVGLIRIELQEISGYIGGFQYEFEKDTSFSLPLNNIEGQVKLIGADVKINEKNTFENLYASLRIIQADLYGGGAAPYAIFGSDPYVIQVIPSNEFVNVLPEETLDLQVDTRYNSLRLYALMDFNSSDATQVVKIVRQSSLDMEVDAVIPMRFNIPGIYNIDTLDITLSEISAPELVEEIRLNVDFESEMPFNLQGQLYTINAYTGQVTDSLMTTPMHINGSFDGSPAKSTAVISITRDRLRHLMASDQLIMRFGVDTDGNDVMLNLDNGLDMTLKADVFYGGTLDVNN